MLWDPVSLCLHSYDHPPGWGWGQEVILTPHSIFSPHGWTSLASLYLPHVPSSPDKGEWLVSDLPFFF